MTAGITHPLQPQANGESPRAEITLTAEVIVDGLLPSDPQISPDGRFVAFVVAPVGQREERPTSAIWLAPTDGATSARQLTAGTAEDCSPRWSPDGASLFFLADRAERGKAQLHRLPLGGGEAAAVTKWAAGIAAFAPLPDGCTVALLAIDEPTEEEERRRRERDDADVLGSPWRYQRLRLLDLPTGAIRTIAVLGDRHVAEVAPASSGDRLAVIAWPTPELSYCARDAEIYLIDASMAVSAMVCRLPCGGDSMTWDRDGERLYLLANTKPDLRGGRVILSVDLATGRVRPLTADLAGCTLDLARGPDTGLLATFAEGLDSALLRLDSAGEQIVRVAEFRGGVKGLSANADGRRVALCRSFATEPLDVWAGPPEGPLIRVSDLCPEVRGIRWGEQERLAWQAPDGLALDGLLILPPGRQRDTGPFPLVTLVHGGPYGRFADELQLGSLRWGQWLAAAGFAIFLPNPRGGQGRGHEFADQVAGAVGTDDWHDVSSGIDALIAEGVADPDRLGIGGWSQGGFMTAWAIGQTDRFKAGVAGAGPTDWGMMVAESDLPFFEAMLGGSTGWEGPGPHRHDALSPISFAGRIKTPVLILHGAEDERVPVSQGRYFARALRAYGVPHELVVYPREPHGIRERNHQLDVLRRVRDWFVRWLGDPLRAGA